jgi:hypothetical protein
VERLVSLEESKRQFVFRVAIGGTDLCLSLQGIFGGPWYRKLFKLFNLFLGLACLSAACLGTWAAGEAIKATFAIASGAASFGCKAPV